MSAMALAFRQIKFENKSFWRNPASAFFTFAFPLMFLVIFNTVFGNGKIPIFGRSVAASNFYVPSIAAFAVITACFTNIAMSISFARDQGVLKRKLGTPLPAISYLAGRIMHATVIQLLLVSIVVVAGKILYKVDVPTDTLPAFLLALAVGAVSFSALGLAITSLVPNADAAPAVVNAVVLPLLFISDIFFGPSASPQWLRSFANLFPIRHYLQAMLHAFNPFQIQSGLAWKDLAVVAAWGVLGIILAAKFFDWEPRK